MDEAALEGRGEGVVLNWNESCIGLNREDDDLCTLQST